MKETFSDSGRVPPELRWTVWFGGFFSRPIVRNNIAGLAETLAVMHLWTCGLATGRYPEGGVSRWTIVALLIFGCAWMMIARTMREKFAVMDADRARFLKRFMDEHTRPPNAQAQTPGVEHK